MKLGDTDLRRLTQGEMRHVRGRQVGMIFQDPMMTLNPVLRVETQMRDGLLAHVSLPRAKVRARLVAALAEVGIAATEQRLRAWPMNCPAECASAWQLRPRCCTVPSL